MGRIAPGPRLSRKGRGRSLGERVLFRVCGRQPGDLLLVLEALLGADDLVDALAVAVLLLELHVLLVELLRLRARQRVEAELVDDARALALLGALLELAEAEEELLRVVALLELLRRGRARVRGRGASGWGRVGAWI